MENSIVLTLLLLGLTLSSSAHTTPPLSENGQRHFVSTPQRQQPQKQTVQCIDVEEDLQLNDWVTQPRNAFNFSATADSLPGVLQGQVGLEGRGIFYIEPHVAVNDWYGVWARETTMEMSEPIFMYVKYYGHVAEAGSTKYLGVHPVRDGDSGVVKFLPETENFEWAESWVELDALTGERELYPAFFARYFDVGDVLLFEKIIVTEGYPIGGVQDMYNLCGWDYEGGEGSTTVDTTTTTTTTTVPITTTQSSGEEFKCTSEGFFADPVDCTKFHQCRYDDVGDFIDTVFECPETTVWCTATTQCESTLVCECELFL